MKALIAFFISPNLNLEIVGEFWGLNVLVPVPVFFQ